MKFVNLPESLKPVMSTALAMLGQSESELTLTFKKQEKDGFSVTKTEDNAVTVRYGRLTDALRGVSFAARVAEEGTPVEQTPKFETLSVMVDCSRNAVLNIESAKELMLQLSLMGYNSIMFYTEDTYEVEGYPYFGHMRGRYSIAEMKELDAYAVGIGMEIIPCIQTLAHLNALKDWDAFSSFMDIDDIMLTDDERTYALIEAMFKTLKSCFSSKRIHVGMDEAHHLGRGKHQDKFGPEAKSDIMLRHLTKVVELCSKYDYEPIMWSDMFFRMQFDGKYYVNEGELSPAVTAKIPPEVALCYWDYYSNPNAKERIDHMFACHNKVGNPVWFAGGAWTWSGVCPKNKYSLWVTPNHLELAEKNGVKHVFPTCWGDDGAECAIFSVLPSLLQYAEYCYDNIDPETMEKRSLECFGISHSDFVKLGIVGDYDKPFHPTSNHPYVTEKYALYNDPMLGIMDRDVKDNIPADKYAGDLAALSAVSAGRFDYLFETQRKLAALLDKKTYLSLDIKAAYRTGDKEALWDIVYTRIPELKKLLAAYRDAFFYQWHRVNKSFGWEIQDMRLGGLDARLTTTARRIEQYLSGSLTNLEELEEADLPWNSKGGQTDYFNSWRRSSTRSIVYHQ